MMLLAKEGRVRTATRNVFSFLPVQLFVLHFRKYQVLLIFWAILLATITGNFMKLFGADALFLTPEYLGSVNFASAAITGAAFGIFVMSWNITTFILHGRRVKFLATTPDPFLRYCINNALLPLIFLLYYITEIWIFGKNRELLPPSALFSLIGGLLLGLIVILLLSFAWFFGTAKTIQRSMAPIIRDPVRFNKTFPDRNQKFDPFSMRSSRYLSKGLRLKKCRDVSHYRHEFLDLVFRRHHIAAVVSLFLAFAGIIVIGFLLDYPAFEIPAAACAFVVFALSVALIGALSWFLQSWSLAFVILIVAALNFCFERGWLDPRNKAYGLKYDHKELRPAYNRDALIAMTDSANIAADKALMLRVLENWKAKQSEERPLMVFINVSGGGLRSAAFTMNALQSADSMTGGELMKHTVLISGASGGMLAAAYYRELYRQKLSNSKLNISAEQYTNNVSKDLLNPVFTSLMARDLFVPVQTFTRGGQRYVKDRAFAFEEQLNENTNGLLDKNIGELRADELSAKVPMIIFNSAIKSDARKLMISPLGLTFMMKPVSGEKDASVSADAVDFGKLFKNQNADSLRLLSALRMNATFPYVLPDVWLPANPAMDVMDGGLRDNYGQETTLRFILSFREWIKQNTSGVLILQFRDRPNDNWLRPFETKSFTDMLISPATMLQYNWFKLQDYYLEEGYDYALSDSALKMKKAVVMYISEKKEETAALNFHITASESKSVRNSLSHPLNVYGLHLMDSLLKASSLRPSLRD